MKSIDSHIQPKYFLKGFLADKKVATHADYLFVYKKGMPFKTDGTRKENNPSKSGLDNVAFVRNFYAFLKDDGTEDPETYERKLEHEVECPGNPVLDKLRTIQLKKDEVIKIKEFLSEIERRKFTRYIAGMYARSKKNRENFDKITYTATQDTNLRGFSYAEIVKSIPLREKEKLERFVRSENPNFDEATFRLTMPPKFIEEFIKKTQKDETFPKSIFRAIDLLEPIILNMKWQLRITPNLHKFFTGEHPVTYTDLRHPNAELLFPISSNAIFCASNNQKLPEIIYLERNFEFVRKVREEIVKHCNEIYFSMEAKWLVDFFNKR